MSGYADDTVLYLCGGNHIPTVLDILDTFSRVSGLTINCIVSALGPYDPGRVVESHGLSLLGPKSYAGISGYWWDTATRQNQTGTTALNPFALDSLWLVKRLTPWGRENA